MRKTLKLGAVALAVAVPAAQAQAERIFGLTGGNSIVTFDSSAPGVTTSSGTIGGLGGDTLTGLDLRPANRTLYSVGTSGNVYAITKNAGGPRLYRNLARRDHRRHPRRQQLRHQLQPDGRPAAPDQRHQPEPADQSQRHAAAATPDTDVTLNGGFYSVDQLSGAGSFIGNLGTTGVTGITAGAIPEPAAWALMITGFGLIGGAMRRRAAGTMVAA